MSRGMASTRKGNSRRQDDRGAALVEFALLAPVLFAVVFALIEFGWTFVQNLDVRHGAREGVRLAAVNYNPEDETDGADQLADIITEVCSRMDVTGGASVELTYNASGETEVGSVFTIKVTRPLEQLTGFLSPVLDGKTVDSTVEARMETDGTWQGSTGPVSCGP